MREIITRRENRNTARYVLHCTYLFSQLAFSSLRGFTLLSFFSFLLISPIIISCQEEHEHTAPAINARDSVPVMVTNGVNTLISDSGVIKYRIVAERWEVNEARNPSRWVFDKGILLTQFNEKLHVEGYIQCDSAVYFDKVRLWQLHGRVRILTKQGLQFESDELYWDEQNHKFWSNSYSHMKMPGRELEGNYFESDERMTNYEIRQTRGKLDRNEATFGNTAGAASTVTPASSPVTPPAQSNADSARGAAVPSSNVTPVKTPITRHR